MKEVIYTYQSRGCYAADKPTIFETDDRIRLIIEPHQFELKLSGKTLRDTSCNGYIIDVSRKGEVCFYDAENDLLAKADETPKEYERVVFEWAQDHLTLRFGHTEIEDYYPNCDGEHDRWGTTWISEYVVTLNTATNEIQTSA